MAYVTLIHTYTHMHIITHMQTHHMHTLTNIHIHHRNTHTHWHACTMTCTHTHTLIRIHTDMHAHWHTRTLTHTYAHTQTHIHTHKYTASTYIYIAIKGMICQDGCISTICCCKNGCIKQWRSRNMNTHRDTQWDIHACTDMHTQTHTHTHARTHKHEHACVLT